jgi:hypothetical protein
MTARVLPFRRRQTGHVVAGRHVPGLAIALEARPGWVVLTAHDLQLGFRPDQARELSRALAELADYVERGQP